MAKPRTPRSKAQVKAKAKKIVARKTTINKSVTNKGGSSLHYNKEALHKEYAQTFSITMKWLFACALFIVAYLLSMAIYLGGWSHTPYKDFYQRFGGEEGRIQIDYDGLHIPTDFNN